MQSTSEAEISTETKLSDLSPDSLNSTETKSSNEIVTRTQAKAQRKEEIPIKQETMDSPMTRSKLKKTQALEDQQNPKLFDGNDLHTKTKRKQPSKATSESTEDSSEANPKLRRSGSLKRKKEENDSFDTEDTDPQERPKLRDEKKTTGPKRKKREEEAVKKYYCKFSGCNKSYTSYAAAGEHYRNKHVGDRKNKSSDDEYTWALGATASEDSRWPVPSFPELPEPTEWQAQYIPLRPKPETICSYVYLHHARQHVVTLLNQLNTEHTFLTALLNTILCERLPRLTKPPPEPSNGLNEISTDQPASVPTAPPAGEALTEKRSLSVFINPQWTGDNSLPDSEEDEQSPSEDIIVAAISVDETTLHPKQTVVNPEAKTKQMQKTRPFTELVKIPDILTLKSKNRLLEFKIGYLQGFFDSEKRSISRLMLSLEEVWSANMICFGAIKGLQNPQGEILAFQTPDYRECVNKLHSILDKRLGQAFELILRDEPISKRDVLNLWIVSPNGEYYPSFDKQESLAYFCNLLPKQITSALSNWRMRHKPLVEVYDKKVFKEQPPIIVAHYNETQPAVPNDLFGKVCSIVACFSYLRQVPLSERDAFQLIDFILDQFYEACDESTSERDVSFFETFYEFASSLLVLHTLTCHRAKLYLTEYVRCICETDPEHIPLKPIHLRLKYGEQQILMRPLDVSEKSMPRKVFSHKHFSQKSVNYLKSWLKVNVDDPYPTKREYEKLAEGTGLSESQVRDWFVNARRRLIEGPKPYPQKFLKRKGGKGDKSDAEPKSDEMQIETMSDEMNEEIERSSKRKIVREDPKMYKKAKREK